MNRLREMEIVFDTMLLNSKSLLKNMMQDYTKRSERLCVFVYEVGCLLYRKIYVFMSVNMCVCKRKKERVCVCLCVRVYSRHTYRKVCMLVPCMQQRII